METEGNEFASKLRTEGTTLSFPVGKPLGGVLDRFGFHHEQDVIIRFARSRMEIWPRDTPEVIRERLREATQELKRFADRIEGYAQELPPVTDEELEAGESWEAGLLGMLECLLADDLAPAIEKLESVERLGAQPPGEAEERKPGRA
jgi:hypothetical protein